MAEVFSLKIALEGEREFKAALPQIISGIVSAVGAGVGQMVSVGGKSRACLWNGIQGLAGWLWNKVSSWCSNLWDGILVFFGIHSPPPRWRGLAACSPKAWRVANPNIIAMWRDIDSAAIETIITRSTVTLGNLSFTSTKGMLFITLPSGRRLADVKPGLGVNRFGGTSITYWGQGINRK